MRIANWLRKSSLFLVAVITCAPLAARGNGTHEVAGDASLDNGKIDFSVRILPKIFFLSAVGRKYNRIALTVTNRTSVNFEFSPGDQVEVEFERAGVKATTKGLLDLETGDPDLWATLPGAQAKALVPPKAVKPGEKGEVAIFVPVTASAPQPGSKERGFPDAIILKMKTRGKSLKIDLHEVVMLK